VGRAIAAVATASSIVWPKIGAAIAKYLFQFASVALGGYRPEQHYMRGPGPAYRAKHGLPPQ